MPRISKVKKKAVKTKTKTVIKPKIKSAKKIKETNKGPIKISKTYIPKDTEKYMCEKHKVFFRMKLQEWRKELGEHSIWDTASIDCNEGDILFWRSHKFHFVPVSRKPGRLSLSCNYVPELVELGGYGFRVSPA